MKKILPLPLILLSAIALCTIFPCSSVSFADEGDSRLLSGAFGGFFREFEISFNGRRIKKKRRKVFRPFGKQFRGGVRVAVGDINADGVGDLISIPGPNSDGPLVRVFDGNDLSPITSSPAGEFFAFNEDFAEGSFVASGDINDDGTDDICVGAGGTAGQVNVFSGTDASQLSSFFAYQPNFTGGVRVAAGDVNGDGADDIITGPGPGGEPRVKVFDGATLRELSSFLAFEESFTGGVFVAVGDFNGDSSVEIVAAAGKGKKPIIVFDALTGNELLRFRHRGGKNGVTVATGDLTGDGKPEVVVTGAVRLKKNKKRRLVFGDIHRIGQEDNFGIDGSVNRIGRVRLGTAPTRLIQGDTFLDTFSSFRTLSP